MSLPIYSQKFVTIKSVMPGWGFHCTDLSPKIKQEKAIQKKQDENVQHCFNSYCNPPSHNMTSVSSADALHKPMPVSQEPLHPETVQKMTASAQRALKPKVVAPILYIERPMWTIEKNLQSYTSYSDEVETLSQTIPLSPEEGYSSEEENDDEIMDLSILRPTTPGPSFVEDDDSETVGRSIIRPTTPGKSFVDEDDSETIGRSIIRPTTPGPGFVEDDDSETIEHSITRTRIPGKSFVDEDDAETIDLSIIRTTTPELDSESQEIRPPRLVPSGKTFASREELIELMQTT